MKVTIKKKKPERLYEGPTAGYTDEIYIDGEMIRDVTSYQITRKATMLGFEVTICRNGANYKFIADDVEIIEGTLSAQEREQLVNQIQELFKQAFSISIDSKELASIVIKELNSRVKRTGAELVL